MLEGMLQCLEILVVAVAAVQAVWECQGMIQMGGTVEQDFSRQLAVF
jgi:hypothetical protein